MTWQSLILVLLLSPAAWAQIPVDEAYRNLERRVAAKAALHVDPVAAEARKQELQQNAVRYQALLQAERERKQHSWQRLQEAHAQRPVQTCSCTYQEPRQVLCFQIQTEFGHGLTERER